MHPSKLFIATSKGKVDEVKDILRRDPLVDVN